MSLPLFSLLLYSVYTLIACAVVSRRDWTRRSIAIGGYGWIAWPLAALFGLLVPGNVISDWNRRAFFSPVPPFALLGLLAILHGLSALAIIRATLKAQGYRPDDSSRELREMLLRLFLVPVAGPFIVMTGPQLLASSGLQTSPALIWGGLCDILSIFLVITINGASVGIRMAVGRGSFVSLPPSPLASEILAAYKLEDTHGLKVRSDGRPEFPGKGSAFGPSVARWLRWNSAWINRHSLIKGKVSLPIEFVTNLSPECLTAALLVKAQGLLIGFKIWRTLSGEKKRPRTVPAFFRALAEFDRFLLQPEDPAPLLRRYQTSMELKEIARFLGTQADYAEGMAAVREVLTTRLPEAAPAAGIPDSHLPATRQ